MSLSHEEIRTIVSEAIHAETRGIVKEAVAEVLSLYGMNVEDVEELRKDGVFVRSMRTTSNKLTMTAMVTIVSGIITGALYAIWRVITGNG